MRKYDQDFIQETPSMNSLIKEESVMTKRYFALMILPGLILFAIHDGHSQTASVSKEVVIALDNSGSMNIDDPELPVSEVVSAVLGSLSEDSRVSFVVFAGKLRTVMPLTSVKDEEVSKKAEEAWGMLKHSEPGTTVTVTIRKGDTLWELADKYYGDPYKWPLILEMNRLPESGRDLPVGTVIQIPAKDAEMSPRATRRKARAGIPLAIEKAIYDLKQNGRQDAEKQIILIADGLIDVRDSALAVERYRWLKNELASESKSAGIRIFSIALTEQADFQFMQTLAQKTNGAYYRVFENADIQTALDGINEPVSKLDPVPEPKPQMVQVGTAREEERKWLPRGLLIAIATVAGVGVLTIFVFMSVKGGGKTRKSSTSIAGAYLMDLSGVTEKSNYAISKDIIKIGRANSEDVDICISRSTVSGTHARIEHRDNNFYLTDLGSTNGTYLNDEVERISDEVRLNAGDIISFDQYKFKLVVRGQGDRGAIRPGGSKQAEIRPELPPSAPGVPGEPAAAAASDTGETTTDREVASLEAYLVDASGVTDKESHKISKKVTKIGRAKGGSVDICIDENTISGIHAQIEYKDHGFYLTDLGSRNGTYLNEERERITSEVYLKGNDVVYLDQYKFKFVVHKERKYREAQLSASPSGMIGG